MILRKIAFIVGIAFVFAGLFLLSAESSVIRQGGLVLTGIVFLAHSFGWYERLWRPEYFYVQWRKNQIRVRNVSTGQEEAFIAEHPFSSQRLLFAHFAEGEYLLLTALRRMRAGGLVPRRAQVIMHPMELIDGGLSGVERRPYYHAAEGAGAAFSEVWLGDPLSDNEVISKIAEYTRRGA